MEYEMQWDGLYWSAYDSQTMGLIYYDVYKNDVANVMKFLGYSKEILDKTHELA